MAKLVRTGDRPPMPPELVGAMVMNSCTLTDGQGAAIHALVVVSSSFPERARAVYWERAERRFVCVELE